VKPRLQNSEKGSSKEEKDDTDPYRVFLLKAVYVVRHSLYCPLSLRWLDNSNNI